MKKLFLFILFSSNYFLAQNIAVEIRLVNQNYGAPAFNGTMGNTTESNDVGLNQILQTHNVYQYLLKEGHLYPPFSGRHVEMWCTTCDYSQLTSDLIAYSNVIEKARITTNGSPFSDNLILQIANINIGVPTGISNGIIETNDAGLNQIFQNYSVYYYEQYAPSSSNSDILRYYKVVCDCDNTALKNALDNYTSVISLTEYPYPVYLLHTNELQKNKISIFPNPFSTNFNIQSDDFVSNYTLIDISGKQLIATSSKNELDNLALQLNSGVYFLNLNFEKGQTVNFKLIKE
jgi:hypothetical protein